MNRTLIFLILATNLPAWARSTDTDGDWTSQKVELADTREAERIIRIGDIDNLGFGFTEAFNPFTGRPTDSHAFPFEPSADDLAPTDRILVGSGFTGQDIPEGQDGYTADFDPSSRPLKNSPIVIPLDSLKGVTVRDAILCLMVDDFQASQFKSHFQATMNGVRFPEMEKSLNALLQTGPIGKVIYVRLTQEMLEQLKGESLSILIDDPTTKAGDGFAFDFAKLMINVKEFIYVGNVPGRVVDDETGEPIASAKVEALGFQEGATTSEGAFMLRKIPAGLSFIQAGATGYSSAQATVDVIGGETSDPIELRLKKSSSATFTGKEVREGDSITLNKIQFDLNSANLRSEAVAELDRVASFLKENPQAEILLSGHTSSEGAASLNRNLSFQRVLSCKMNLIERGIDSARITTVGHGPDQPIAPNDTEANRAVNRRVEMRITKL